MEDNLRKYIDEIFKDCSPTVKTVELKEEMLQNLTDKYSDLIAEGKTPSAAYNIAVAGIGDVTSLLQDIQRDTNPPNPNHDINRRISAMLKASAAMLYILSCLPIIILSQFRGRLASFIGIPLLFIMIACATGLLIYNSSMYPKRRNYQDTLVDEFRQWQAADQRSKSMRSSISFALWSVILALYFIISFTSNAWHISWIIFLLGAVVESAINILYNLRK